MLRSLIISSLLVTAFTSVLFGEEKRSPAEPLTLPLVGEYADFLEATKKIATADTFYNSDMSDQIVQKKTADGFSYLLVADQDDQPMHHLTEIDVTCYNNWKKDSSTSSNIQTPSSPLMMFEEETPEEKEKQADREIQQREATDGRLRECDTDSSQASFSLDSRATLDGTQRQKNLAQKYSSLTLLNSKTTRTPNTTSLVSLLKTAAVATLLKLSNSFLAVKAEAVVTNHANLTTSNSPFEERLSQRPSPPYLRTVKSSLSYFDKNFIPLLVSSCIYLEDRSNFLLSITDAVPFLKGCNLQGICPTTHPLANWLRCDQLPDSAFYKRFNSLQTSSNDLLYSETANIFPGIDITKADELSTRWTTLIQECEEKAMTTPSLFAHKAWNSQQEEAEQYYYSTQSEILRRKARTSYSSLEVALSNLNSALPNSLDAIEHQVQIASYNKAISVCEQTKTAYQDLIDYLTTHRNSMPKKALSNWDEVTHETQGILATVHFQKLQLQREVLIHEATQAEEGAWFNPKQIKKITDETITTLARNWDQVVEKLRETNEVSKEMAALEHQLPSFIKEDARKSQHLKNRAALLEHKLLWALAAKETQLVSVHQKQKMAELPDMSNTYFDPTVVVPSSITFEEPLPEEINRVSALWRRVFDFSQEQLQTAPEIFQQEWKELFDKAERNKEELYMNLVAQELAYRSSKKSASDPRIKRQAAQEPEDHTNCDSHLKTFEQNARKKTLPPAWQKFSTEKDTICQELPQQAEENAEIIRNGLLKWYDLERDDKEFLLTQSIHINQTRNQLQELLTRCDFGCPSTALNATTRSFEKQEKLSQAITARQAREESNNKLRSLIINEYQHYSTNHTLVEAKIISMYQEIKELLKNESLAFKNTVSFFNKSQQARIKKSTQQASEVTESTYYLSVYYKAMHLLRDVQRETEKIDHQKPPIIKIGVDATQEKEKSQLSESSALDKLHQELNSYLSKHDAAIQKTNNIKKLLESFLEFSEDFSPNEFIKIVADKGDAFVCTAEANVIQTWLQAQKETFLATTYKDFASLYPSLENWHRSNEAFSTVKQTWQSLGKIVTTYQANPRIAHFRFSLTNLMDKISPEIKKNIVTITAEIEATKQFTSSQKNLNKPGTSSSKSRAKKEAIARGAM